MFYDVNTLLKATKPLNHHTVLCNMGFHILLGPLDRHEHECPIVETRVHHRSLTFMALAPPPGIPDLV